jgi:hypothetical protein
MKNGCQNQLVAEHDLTILKKEKNSILEHCNHRYISYCFHRIAQLCITFANSLQTVQPYCYLLQKCIFLPKDKILYSEGRASLGYDSVLSVG